MTFVEMLREVRTDGELTKDKAAAIVVTTYLPADVAKIIADEEAAAKYHHERGQWELAAAHQEAANNLKRGAVQTAGPLPKFESE